MQNIAKRITRVAIGTGLILLIPLALQLTIGTGVDGQGFNWGPSDFAVMGVLLFVAGLAIELAAHKLSNPTSRVRAIIIIIVVFLLIWADLAVGIFNIPGISGS